MGLTIPEDVLQAARMSEDELRRELAVMLFQQERLSLGKACELAQMSRATFQHLLASRSIPPHYDVSDFDDDMQTLNDLEPT